MSEALPKVLAIVGPTAVGKTALSIELAKRFSGEIISGDSLQIYRGLDIGTAKVTAEEQAGVPHFLIDEREADENYTAYDFQKKGREKIEAIIRRGHLPIIVGGTGLYIQSLLYDYQLGGDAAWKETQEKRAHWEAYLATHGKEALWEKLAQKDPAAAESVHPNNARRVIRLLERAQSTPKVPPKALYDFYLLGLEGMREELYQRINQRVDQMVESGLIDEAHQLYELQKKRGHTLQSAQGIGYKELFPYFAGEKPLADCLIEIKQNSRRYAKRQLTWFKNRMPVHWHDLTRSGERECIAEEVENWLSGGTL